ncbi:MAG TPA: ribosome-associated translation inhibitor RaiA [Planctomycetota bacterium]|nr:ribosome-associated translation inhibitor RaiA [Planctomycetota bacterium]
MIAIHISGIHCHVSDRTRAYIHDKFGDLDRYHARLHAVHVTIHGGEREGYRADTVMHLHSGKEVVAHAADKSLFAAIDGAAGKSASQLRKIHERERDVHRSHAEIAV